MKTHSNKYVLFLFFITVFSFFSSAQVQDTARFGTFIDVRDGHSYKYVKIGEQVWMTQNLAFKPKIGTIWFLTSDSTQSEYGYLYDWEAAQVACPQGWHLPSEDEWTKMIKHLGGSNWKPIGEKLMNTTGWGKSKKITNESGFSALPAGHIWIDPMILMKHKAFHTGYGKSGMWWSSTSGNYFFIEKPFKANTWFFASDYSCWNECGLSIRCIKD